MSATQTTRDGNFVPGGSITVIEQLDLTTKFPQTVAILDGSGNQVTSFGGGTQYTEGDTDATITGTAAMMEVGSNTLQPIQGTVADGLLVNLGSNNDVTLATLPDTASGDLAAINAALAGTLTVTGGGGGTEYTEDDAAAANPVGGALILVREDARAGSLTTADGDNVAARGNNKGEMYVKTTDSDALLTTIDADTGNIATATAAIQTAVEGTLTVDLGVNNDVTVTGTVDLGATDNAVLDAIAASLSVLDDWDDANYANVNMNIAGTDVVSGSGTSTGALRVELPTNGTGVIATVGAVTSITNAVTVNSHAVTNAGTFAVQVDGAALTSLQLIDDVIIADDAAFTPATTKVAMVGFTFDDVSPDSVNEGDAGAARMSANRNIYTTIRDAAGNERGVNVTAGNALTVDGSATTQPVSGTVSITSNSAVNVAQMNGVATSMGNGASGTGVQRVTMANDSTGILAGVTTVTTVSTLTGGGVAHDGADSGNPIKMGGRAVNADITAVSANNDRTDFVATLTGKQIVQPYSNPENFVDGTPLTLTDTTSTSCMAAPAGSLRNYITQILVTNSHATVGTLVKIQDGSGGTTIYQGYAAPVGGGFSISFPTPLKQPTTATAVYVACGTTGSNTYVSMSGYKAA